MESSILNLTGSAAISKYSCTCTKFSRYKFSPQYVLNLTT
eukprot:SAG31_NODE_213_length_20124_cov_17.709613_10_plen_40_part_00